MKKQLRLPSLCMICVLLLQLCMIPAMAYAKKQPKNENTQRENKEHVLLFTSDVHEQLEEKLVPFLKRYSETVDKTEFVCYGGDYAKKFDEEILKQVVKINHRLLPSAKMLFTVGNHDMEGFDHDKFVYITNMEERGIHIKKGGYVLYTFGASSKEQQFSKQDLEQLQHFLETTREYIPRIPIIIISHFPLHFYNDGTKKTRTKGANELVELLNDYSNVVFLYGHNHTLSDPNYCQIHMPGDEIRVEEEEYKTINFCYTSLGAMKDGANQDVYGLRITIKNTACCNQVMLEHLNYYAEPKDKMMVCYPLVEEY